MVNSKKPILVIVIPCYNEEEVLAISIEKLSAKITELVSKSMISKKSSLLFVDDGSKDKTWSLIEEYKKENPGLIQGIRLPVNCGHQNALVYGMFHSKNYADVIITIDADLQDDINSIDSMLESFLSGFEIVLGVRSSRQGDGFLKKTSAGIFYGLMHFLGAGIVKNHADFRLISKNAIDALAVVLAAYKKQNYFLRGIITGLGFKTNIVYYNRKQRFAGKSKYNVLKMFKLALNGFAYVFKKKFN